jgi:hypothetical protein
VLTFFSLDLVDRQISQDGGRSSVWNRRLLLAHAPARKRQPWAPNEIALKIIPPQFLRGVGDQGIVLREGARCGSCVKPSTLTAPFPPQPGRLHRYR